MPLAPSDRAAFLEMMSELGPGGDPSGVLAFVADHPASLEEFGARPGMDQVRAGLLRIVDSLEGADAHREAARQALNGYREDVSEPDPAILLERAPSWVGLAWLELAGRDGWTSEVASEAAALARIGFEAAKMQGIGQGELLWALAEAAAETGWTDRERFLLDEARRASFEAEERAGEVALLYGMRCLEDGDVEGIEVLEAVSELATSADHTRVHARAILGSIALEHGDAEAARGWFEAALAAVDEAGEPDVAAQLRGVLEGI